jgi:TrmH family RNA methyltransferase
MMITSAQNPKIHWLRQLQRDRRRRAEDHVFVVEGVRLAEEALKSGWQAQLVIFSEDLSDRGRSVVEGFRAQGAQVEQVKESVLRSASDTQAPQGLVAAIAWRVLPLPPQPDFLFIPDRVRDPGNLGAMLRTAAAAGAQAALIPPESSDAFAPKTLRAGMGAHFRLPILNLDYPQFTANLEGFQVCLAAAGQGISYTQVDFRRPSALVIGGEADGASPQIGQLATCRVSIPMPGGGESLNAAVAAGILLFEAARQRIQPQDSP